MSVPLAAGLLRLAALYLLAGALLLPWLFRRTWPAAAPGAHGATWGFLCAALPGTLLLWPLLLRRARHPALPNGEEITPLRRLQLLLALGAAFVVVLALCITITTRHHPPVVDHLPGLGASR